MILRSLLFSLFVFLGVGVQADSFEVPALTSPVMDEVGLLNSSTKNQLENSLYDLRKNNGIQLQVYIVKSLQGEDIASATIKIFDKWKLGDEKTDKGLLFLVAPNEKRMRIEVGRGLEGDLPDVIAKRIIADIVKPYFKNGQYDAGIVQGVASIENYILNTTPEQKQVQENVTRSDSKGSGMWIALIILGIWILLFIFNPSLALYILFSAMRGGGGGGSSGGRDSWSGGGGSSAGGGASGDW
ncbi:MAG: TPM domain-containing protein [Pseudobdellovibrio sp.]